METKKTVLIVEDDTMIVEMYKDKFKNEGYRVLTATDGRRALQRIKSSQADLILLDILMPGLNGFEVLKRIKADRTTKDIPVLVLTNIGSDSLDKDKKLAISLGASDYMIKSLNTPEDVAKKAKSILDK